MDDDLDLTALDVLAGDDANTPTDEGNPPEPAEHETGDQDESEGAGDDAGGEGEAEQPSEEEKPEPKPKKPSGSERLRRRLDALEAENAALRATRETPKGAEGGPKSLAERVQAEIGEAPKESDYAGDFMAFEQAKLAYELDKRQVTRELKRADEVDAQQSEKAKEASKTAEQTKFADMVSDHRERLSDLEKAIPGSAAKIDAAVESGKLAPSPAVLPLILDSEKSAHLALYLADRPEKVAELNGMSPVAAARELGRLESRLSIPKTPTATKAPAPVKPLKGAAAPTVDPSRMSQAQYEAWRAKGGGSR